MLNIILDLDETLIYSLMCFSIKEVDNCSIQDLYIGYFFIGNIYYVIFVRPYLFDFLDYLINNKYNIYISTHSNYEYANNVINLIQKHVCNFTYIDLQTRIIVDNEFIKLKTLENFCDTKNTLIIDDKKDVWELKYHKIIYNIQIFKAPYYILEIDKDKMKINKINWDYVNDKELLYLITYLDRRVYCEEVLYK